MILAQIMLDISSMGVTGCIGVLRGIDVMDMAGVSMAETATWPDCGVMGRWGSTLGLAICDAASALEWLLSRRLLGASLTLGCV